MGSWGAWRQNAQAATLWPAANNITVRMATDCTGLAIPELATRAYGQLYGLRAEVAWCCDTHPACRAFARKHMHPQHHLADMLDRQFQDGSFLTGTVDGRRVLVSQAKASLDLYMAGTMRTPFSPKGARGGFADPNAKKFHHLSRLWRRCGPEQRCWRTPLPSSTSGIALSCWRFCGLRTATRGERTPSEQPNSVCHNTELGFMCCCCVGAPCACRLTRRLGGSRSACSVCRMTARRRSMSSSTKWVSRSWSDELLRPLWRPTLPTAGANVLPPACAVCTAAAAPCVRRQTDRR